MIIDGEEGEKSPVSFEEFEAKVTAADEPENPGAEEEKQLPEPEEPGPDEEISGEEEAPKAKKSSNKDMENLRLKNERNEAREQAAALAARIEALEKRLTGENPADTSTQTEEIAPDPNDLEKYPLGILDDRYQRDNLNYLVADAMKKNADSERQRQAQIEAQTAQEREIEELRSKVDTVAEKGAAIHDDYTAIVIEAGLRKEYALEEPTFLAAAEADHGAQILYNLATDPAEAARVAGLSPVQQVRYVVQKDLELAGNAPPSANKTPKAPTPPGGVPRGASKRQGISPATTNFEEFERLASATG